MGAVRNVAIGVFVISFMTFVALFGRNPSLRSTPVGALYRLICKTLPRWLRELDERLTRGRLNASTARLWHHLMYERHPTVLIFFIALFAISELIFLPSAWPRFETSTKYLATIGIPLPYIFLYLATNTDPGFITAQNHAENMTLYPYDHTIFHPGQVCTTCQFPKPARSKHCSMCKGCIARCDHHCVFINCCVGYGNHHWFLLLLFTTAMLATYAAYISGCLLSDSIRITTPTWTVWGSGFSWNAWFSQWGAALSADTGMGSVGLLCLFLSPLVWGLLSYNIYLIWAGATTNESLKWSDWQYEIREGHVFKRLLVQPNDSERLGSNDPPSTHWPVECKQEVVMTADGSLPYPLDPPQGEWVQIHSLSDVDNLYDLGFWRNLKDVFLPRQHHNTSQYW